MDTVAERQTLEAFVDGALGPEESARIVLHLADTPGDAAYVDALMEVNALLAAAYAEPLHEAAPERLRRTIFPATPPAASPAVWRPRLPARRVAWAAAAATMALALAVGLAVSPWRGSGPVQIAAVPSGDGALREALERSPSGAVAGGAATARITLIATFFDADGRPCREYEILDPDAGALTQGIACRAPGAGWSTEVAVASRLTAPEERGESFVPAEGAGDGALDGALDRLGAGMLLTPDEEAALIEGDWPPQK